MKIKIERETLNMLVFCAMDVANMAEAEATDADDKEFCANLRAAIADACKALENAGSFDHV